MLLLVFIIYYKYTLILLFCLLILVLAIMSRAKQNLEEFIVLFRDLPCLWQTKSKDYHDRTKKAAAYEKLVQKLKEVEPQATKDCVLKEINNLRSSYRKEI